jgi:hypothetical protein
MSKRTSGKTSASGLAVVGLVLTAAAVAGTAGPAGAATDPRAHNDLRFTAMPSDITVRATDPTGAVVRYTTPTAWDRTTATDAPVSCTPASGSTFPVGRTEVVCTADDAGLTSASRSFHVTVRPARTGLTPDRSRLTFTGTARANRTQTVTVTNHGPDATPIGPMRITGPDARAFRATDDCGNTLPEGSTCTVTVTYRPNATGHRRSGPQQAKLVLGNHTTVTLVGNTSGRGAGNRFGSDNSGLTNVAQQGRGRG